MPKKLYTEERIQDIANAIRSQNELSDTYTTAQMASAIQALIWKGTQAEYDAITTKNQSTLYIILEE